MTNGREPATLEEATEKLTNTAVARDDIKYLLQASP